MKLIIEIGLNNDAFSFGSTHHEAGRILEEMFRNQEIERYMPERITLRDINGNIVGHAEVVDD